MVKKQLEIPMNCEKCRNSDHFFCHLSSLEKNQLSTEKNHYFFKKGEYVFYEGERAHNLYCVYSGKAKHVKLGKEGREQIVRLSKSGDIMGYRALLSSEPYQASVITLEDTYVCVLPKENFFSVVETNSRFSLDVMRLLSKDLRYAEQNLVDITQKRVKERVSAALLLLKNTFGFLVDGETLNVKISRGEIADIAGTTTESAIRTLSQLNEENIIQLSGKNITILNLKELVNCTNAYD